MGRQLLENRRDSSPGIPAWVTSVLTHGCLFVVALIVMKSPPPSGAVAEPSRQAGIVLKKLTDEGPLFTGEETPLPAASSYTTSSAKANADNMPPAESPQAASDPRQTPRLEEPLLKVLPNAAELAGVQSSLQESLPNASLLGTAGLPSGAVPNATAHTMGGAPGKKIGGEARVRLFGVEGVGTRFVYLFDRSVSMEGRLLAAAKSQLIASLESLESVHQFQILFFNYQVHTWDITRGQNRIPFATTRNKRLASRFVRGITAEGGTLRREALRRALALRPDVIFFLTDTDNPMASDDVADAIEQANRNGTAIHAIEFGFQVNQGGENFLVQLARSTGGQYAYVDTARLGTNGIAP
jgi:VWA domain-containing protein